MVFLLNTSTPHLIGSLSEQSCRSYEVIQTQQPERFRCEPSSLPRCPDPDADRAAAVAVTRCTGKAQLASLSLAASSLALVSRATVHS